MSRILRALADIDADRDATEQMLLKQVTELRTSNSELLKELQAVVALLSRRTVATGLMIAHLKSKGMTLEELDRLTLGNLDLKGDQP